MGIGAREGAPSGHAVDDDADPDGLVDAADPSSAGRCWGRRSSSAASSSPSSPSRPRSLAVLTYARRPGRGRRPIGTLVWCAGAGRGPLAFLAVGTDRLARMVAARPRTTAPAATRALEPLPAASWSSRGVVLDDGRPAPTLVIGPFGVVASASARLRRARLAGADPTAGSRETRRHGDARCRARPPRLAHERATSSSASTRRWSTHRTTTSRGRRRARSSPPSSCPAWLALAAGAARACHPSRRDRLDARCSRRRRPGDW